MKLCKILGIKNLLAKYCKQRSSGRVCANHAAQFFLLLPLKILKSLDLAHQASRIALQNIVKEELTRKIFYQKGLSLAVQAPLRGALPV